MLKNEIIAIVTRMSGRDSEFEAYFGNGSKVCVTIDAAGSVSSHSRIPDIEHAQLVYFDGLAHAADFYKDFTKMIIKVSQGTKVLLGFHHGVHMDLDQARQKLEVQNLSDYSARNYSIGDNIKESLHPIAQLGFAIAKLLNDNIDSELLNKIEIVRGFILNEDNLESTILNILLPLDIDMQALEALENTIKSKGTNKDTDEYLREMFNDKTDYASRNKEFQKTTNALMNSQQRDVLIKTLVDSATPFLNILQAQAKDKNPSYHDLKNYWQKTKYNSFHEWYCAFAECLTNHGK